MQLSDEDYNACMKKAASDKHPAWPTNNDVASAAYALGVERARNTPDAATRAVIERLVEAQAQSSAIIADAQAILTRYLVPDGITHEQAIHELLGLLDGPVQRDAKLSTSDAIAEARKLLEGDALAQPADEDAWLVEANELVSQLATEAHLRGSLSELGPWSECGEYGELLAHLRYRPQQAGFVSVPVEPTSMRGLSITSSAEDGAWLRFDLPSGASAAISVLLLAEKFPEKSIVSQVLKEWSGMITEAKEGAVK